MRIKLSKCQFAFVVLLAATIIYAVALVASVQAYEVEKAKELSEYPPVLREYVDFVQPFFSTPFAKPYVISGIGLMLCWMSLGLGWLLIGGRDSEPLLDL
jgi:hypothetical protein